MKVSYALAPLTLFISFACSDIGSHALIDAGSDTPSPDASVDVSTPDANSDGSPKIGATYECDPSVRKVGYVSDAGLPVCAFGQTVCSVYYPKGLPDSPTCVASSCTDCACLCDQLVVAKCQYQATSDGCRVLDGGFLMIFADQI